MLLVGCADKNAYSASKTSGVLRDSALGANTAYVLAHCRGGWGTAKTQYTLFNTVCNFAMAKF